MAAEPLSIFISYARIDSAYTDRLEADLQARNFRTWVDRRKLEGGQIWLDELEKAIEGCQILLIVLTPNSVYSKYVRMEYRYAQKLGKLVIPLEFQECPRVPIDLNSLQWVSFTKTYMEGLSNLLISLSPIEITSIQGAPSLVRTSHAPIIPETKEPDLVAPQPAPPRPDPDLKILYRAGIIAKAEGNIDKTAVLWQQILERQPLFMNGTLAPQLQRIQEELHPLRVKRLRERAREAHTIGEWGQEIGAYQALLELEPKDPEALKSIPLAEYNQKYVWMYESAAQFIEEGLLPPAKLQLEMLWRDAPGYGDPKALANKTGIQYSRKLSKIYRGNSLNTIPQTGVNYNSQLTINSENIMGNLDANWLYTSSNGEHHDYICTGRIDQNGRIELTCHSKGPENYIFTYQGQLQPNNQIKGKEVFSSSENITYESVLEPIY